MSLLTVMAGAAVAPALGIIKTHFSQVPDTLMQFIISMPALFIILTNLVFDRLCQWVKTKTLALIGLSLYICCGAIPFFLNDIYVILVFRALLGVSVGIIMPLSTGLLAFYYPPEKQASLMGLSAAMNQMGGVVATLLAGVLANVAWNYAFLVYLLGLIAVVLVLCFLPNERIVSSQKETVKMGPMLKRFHAPIVGMFLCMSLFFVYPGNFALISHRQTSLSNNAITLIMVGLDGVAFAVGLIFGRLMKRGGRGLKYVAPLGFLAGYLVMAFSCRTGALLIGSAFIGIANGVGVPYLNTIASMQGGRNAATTVMPLVSASLYLGQCLSPIYISALGSGLLPSLPTAPYVCAAAFSLLYLGFTAFTAAPHRQPLSAAPTRR